MRHAIHLKKFKNHIGSKQASYPRPFLAQAKLVAKNHLYGIVFEIVQDEQEFVFYTLQCWLAPTSCLSLAFLFDQSVQIEKTPKNQGILDIQHPVVSQEDLGASEFQNSF